MLKTWCSPIGWGSRVWAGKELQLRKRGHQKEKRVQEVPTSCLAAVGKVRRGNAFHSRNVVQAWLGVQLFVGARA